MMLFSCLFIYLLQWITLQMIIQWDLHSANPINSIRFSRTLNIRLPSVSLEQTEEKDVNTRRRFPLSSIINVDGLIASSTNCWCRHTLDLAVFDWKNVSIWSCWVFFLAAQNKVYKKENSLCYLRLQSDDGMPAKSQVLWSHLAADGWIKNRS